MRLAAYVLQMLTTTPLIAFLPSTDLDRSRAFFVDRLGLVERDVSPYALVLEAGGTMLRIAAVSELVPQPFTVLGWTVDDVTALGLEPVLFDGMGQDADGVWTTPGGDRVLWFRDPDGNLLSLTSFGSSASEQ